jgi:hypothetical protein
MALFLGLSIACILSEMSRRLWTVRIIPAVLVILRINAPFELMLGLGELSQVIMTPDMLLVGYEKATSS